MTSSERWLHRYGGRRLVVRTCVCGSQYGSSNLLGHPKKFLHVFQIHVVVNETNPMHSIAKKTASMTRRPQAGLSGSWCISPLPVRDCLPTPSYPASLSEPKFATRNQEAGT